MHTPTAANLPPVGLRESLGCVLDFLRNIALAGAACTLFSGVVTLFLLHTRLAAERKAQGINDVVKLGAREAQYSETTARLSAFLNSHASQSLPENMDERPDSIYRLPMFK